MLLTLPWPGLCVVRVPPPGRSTLVSQSLPSRGPGQALEGAILLQCLDGSRINTCYTEQRPLTGQEGSLPLTVPFCLARLFLKNVIKSRPH